MSHHLEVKPIVDYTPYALNRVRHVRKLWELPLEERKRMVADCLEIFQNRKKEEVFTFKSCVKALTERILNEILEEKESDQLGLYMQIVDRVLEGEYHSAVIPYKTISVEEKKKLFLAYEAVSMSARLAFSPLFLFHIYVDDYFLKVGLNSGIKDSISSFVTFSVIIVN